MVQTKMPTSSEVQIQEAVAKGWHVKDVHIWRRIVEAAKHTHDLLDVAVTLLCRIVNFAHSCKKHPIAIVNLARTGLGAHDITMSVMDDLDKLFAKHMVDDVDRDDESEETIEDREGSAHVSPTQHSQESIGEPPSQEEAHRLAKRGTKRSRGQVESGLRSGPLTDVEADLLE